MMINVYDASRSMRRVNTDGIVEVHSTGGAKEFGFLVLGSGIDVVSFGRPFEAAYVRANMRADTPHNRRGTYTGS